MSSAVFNGHLSPNHSPAVEANCCCLPELCPTVDLPTNTLFIGEIVNIYSEEKYLENGNPNVKKIRPFLLTMPDNRFWALGEQVGNAWKDGVKFRETMT